MKKLSILLFAVLSIGLSSCVIGGADGKDGRDGFVNFKVIDMQVNSNEWKYANQPDNNYFWAKFEVPELKGHVYDNGVVQVYREYDTGTPNAVQTLLPQTRMKEQFANGQVFYYQELVDYEYGVGFINLFYTVSDFIYEQDLNFVPETMHFRATLMW